MKADDLREQFTSAVTLWAKEGLSRLREQDINAPATVLSHVCFKFTDSAAYEETVAAARTLGAVTQQAFGGKQISWCRLDEPVRLQGLALHWLELVEPKTEKSPASGVSSLGYFVSGLKDTVKIPSADGRVTFRYQPKHASALAGQ